VARAAQAAETLLAGREDDDERLVELGCEALDDVDRDGDRERVVADPGADQAIAALVDPVVDVEREDGVDVREQPERVRRLAEPPDEVAGIVAPARPWRPREAFLQPGDARLLAEIRRRDPGQRRRVLLDIRTNERDDRASLLA
jgi:hypothetical protein